MTYLRPCVYGQFLLYISLSLSRLALAGTHGSSAMLLCLNVVPENAVQFSEVSEYSEALNTFLITLVAVLVS